MEGQLAKSCEQNGLSLLEHKVLNSTTIEFTICNILLLHLWICIEVMKHSWNLMLRNVSLIYTKQNPTRKKKIHCWCIYLLVLLEGLFRNHQG
jgi:hypothetical protein